MTESRDDILHPGAQPTDSDFPLAPAGWTPDVARKLAVQLDIDLVDDHWKAVRALHEYYSRHDERIKVRELLDALDEKFHRKGGLKYLYSLFPGGPVAQGCSLAGLPIPAGAIDRGFGSVQ